MRTLDLLKRTISSPWGSFVLGLVVAASIGLLVRPEAITQIERVVVGKPGSNIDQNELAKVVRDEVHGAMALERRRLAKQFANAPGQQASAPPSDSNFEADPDEPDSEVVSEVRSWISDARSTGKWTKAHGERLRESGAFLNENEKRKILRDLMIAYNNRELTLEPGSFMPAIPGHN